MIVYEVVAYKIVQRALHKSCMYVYAGRRSSAYIPAHARTTACAGTARAVHCRLARENARAFIECHASSADYLDQKSDEAISMLVAPDSIGAAL